MAFIGQGVAMLSSMLNSSGWYLR